MPSSLADEPLLDYTNWADWSEYWRDHLTALDLWKFTDPNTQTALPLPSDKVNRDIVKQGTENFTILRQHVSKECRKLLSGKTTLRDLWKALRDGCDRGTLLPLIAKVEAFHTEKWEAKDTISSYTSRLRNLYLSLENTDQEVNRDLAVHILISRLPDCYKSEGQAAKQQNLSFVATAAYLLANVKDSSTSGDNFSGQALVAQASQHLRDGENFSRSPRRGGSRSNGRNFSSWDFPCNWCKRRGHKERDCWTKQRQIGSGKARINKRGKAYMAKRAPVPPHQNASQPLAQVPMHSPNPSVGTQYPQNPLASFNANPVHPTWQGPPQANLAYTAIPPNQIQFLNPNPSSESSHLL
jgi:gag-polypeptide of LTR copia-type